MCQRSWRQSGSIAIERMGRLDGLDVERQDEHGETRDPSGTPSPAESYQKTTGTEKEKPRDSVGRKPFLRCRRDLGLAEQSITFIRTSFHKLVRQHSRSGSAATGTKSAS